MTEHQIRIKADWNDADYVYREEACNQENLDIIQRMCRYFKDNGRQYPPKDINWVDYELCPESFESSLLSNYVTLNEFLIFNDFMPNGFEGETVHTIESIIAIPIQYIKELL